MAINFVGSTAGSAINGNGVTLTLPSHDVNTVSVVAVTLGTSKATALAVASSSGGPYTQIVTTLQTSAVRFGVFRRILASSLELQAVVTGSGGSTDAAAAACHIFGGVDLVSPEDVASTFTSSGFDAAPDSPSITVASCSCAIITSIGCGTVLVPTAPSSFLNSTSASGNDTHDATTAQAWITNPTTAAFNPASWTSTSVVVWCSATTALRPLPGTSSVWLMVDPLYPPVSLGTREIIPY